MTPTVWIHLAPLGVIPVSLMNLLEQLPFPAAREAATVLMLLVWGFGVWWLVAESLRLSKLLGWSSPLAIGVAAWLLLWCFWLITLNKTLRGVISGAIFKPHP